jgi:hypothetical protein
VVDVRVLDTSESLSPRQIEEIDRIYKMCPHLRDNEFVRRYKYIDGELMNKP